MTVKRAAKARGVKTYYQLARLLGDDSDMRAKRLWDGDSLPTLPTLDKVCDALGCDLQDVISRTPNRAHKQPAANGTAARKTKLPKT